MGGRFSTLQDNDFSHTLKKVRRRSRCQTAEYRRPTEERTREEPKRYDEEEKKKETQEKEQTRPRQLQ